MRCTTTRRWRWGRYRRRGRCSRRWARSAPPSSPARSRVGGWGPACGLGCCTVWCGTMRYGTVSVWVGGVAASIAAPKTMSVSLCLASVPRHPYRRQDEALHLPPREEGGHPWPHLAHRPARRPAAARGQAGHAAGVARARACVCVCACVYERGRERGRGREGGREREREGGREREAGSRLLRLVCLNPQQLGQQACLGATPAPRPALPGNPPPAGHLGHPAPAAGAEAAAGGAQEARQRGGQRQRVGCGGRASLPTALLPCRSSCACLVLLVPRRLLLSGPAACSPPGPLSLASLLPSACRLLPVASPSPCLAPGCRLGR